jgi:hypothetical protein
MCFHRMPVIFNMYTCRWKDAHDVERISVSNLTLVAHHKHRWWHGKIGNASVLGSHWRAMPAAIAPGQSQSKSLLLRNASSISRSSSRNVTAVTRRMNLEVRSGLKVLVVRPRFPSNCSVASQSTTCTAWVSLCTGLSNGCTACT